MFQLATFWDKGTEIHTLSRDKEQAQNLATGLDFDSLSCPVLGSPARQKWEKKCWKNGISMMSCFRTSFSVLENRFLNWSILFCFKMSFSYFGTSSVCFGMSFSGLCSFGKVILSQDVQGQTTLSQDFCSFPCPRTKEHRDKKISLSRDKGTSRGNATWEYRFKGKFIFWNENIIKEEKGHNWTSLTQTQTYSMST